MAKANREEDSAQRYITLTAGSCAQVMDMFVEQTHNIDTQMRDGEKPMRFTDTRLDEQERGVSLKMVPMSLVMEGTSGKSFLMNLIDTPGVLPAALETGTGASHAQVSKASYRASSQRPPWSPYLVLDRKGTSREQCLVIADIGAQRCSSLSSTGHATGHWYVVGRGKSVAWGVMMVQDKTLTVLHWHAGHINFNDEVSAAMRLADGVLLVVDAAEGVMMVTDKVIKQAVAEGLPICLLLSKVWPSLSAHMHEALSSSFTTVTYCGCKIVESMPVVTRSSSRLRPQACMLHV